MKALIYNDLGEILRQVEGHIDLIVLQKQDNEFIIFGSADDATQYINVETGEILDKPIKPNDYSEFNYQTKQWESNFDILKAQIDAKRLQLLQKSDWTDTVSAQTRLTNYAEWQAYRQALRDIPTQPGYPENVTWPQQPK